jgi:hypothetical protein
MILDMLQGVEIKPPKISEITVVRYYEEIVITNDGWDQNRHVVTESNLLPKPRLAE